MNRSIRYRAIALCGVAASLLAHSVAYSHHGTAGRYEDELMEISGTVISLMFINRLSRDANGAKVIMTDTGEVIFTEEPPNR